MDGDISGDHTNSGMIQYQATGPETKKDGDDDDDDDGF
jgi:hypothetical protein